MGSESARIVIVVALVCGGVGLICALIGLWRIGVERAFARRATRATGTIVGYKRRRIHRNGARRRYYQFPVVRYTTQAGQQIEFELLAAMQPRPLDRQQGVTILYDPAAPQQARLDSTMLQYGLPAFLVAFGVAMAAVGGFIGFTRLLD